MPPAYQPYAPLNRLKPVARDIWIVDGPEIRMDYVGLKLPFPTRMTVIRLPDGALWIHSPTEPEPGILDEIAALGPVAHIIAPNTLHFWWIPDWHARFPEARVHVAPGVEARAGRTGRTLPPFTELSGQADPAWSGVIEQVLAPGSLLTEVDFFHRPSRTLVLTDLIENFEPERVRSPFMRGLMRLFGAADPDGKAPYDMQFSFRRHRGQMKRAVRQMIDWAPERVILAHGRWYERDGVAELRRAFRWVL